MISAPKVYSQLFEPANPNWSDEPNHNMLFVQAMQNHANDTLRVRGHVTLNDVYDLLGFRRSEEGQLVGWTKGPIDFNIKTNPKTIRLTFRVEGEILGAIKEA